MVVNNACTYSDIDIMATESSEERLQRLDVSESWATPLSIIINT